MDTYVRLYDAEHKGKDDNPTIGLVLCSEKSEAVAKYSVLADKKQLFAAKYLPYLPSEEELSQALKHQHEKAIAQVKEQLSHYETKLKQLSAHRLRHVPIIKH